MFFRFFLDDHLGQQAFRFLTTLQSASMAPFSPADSQNTVSVLKGQIIFPNKRATSFIKLVLFISFLFF